jgi:hypothetical protein
MEPVSQAEQLNGLDGSVVVGVRGGGAKGETFDADHERGEVAVPSDAHPPEIAARSSTTIRASSLELPRPIMATRSD